MSDATDAIVDIQEALSEYGSSITLNITTKGIYDPTTGDTADSIAAQVMKCIISAYNSKELQNEDIHANDLRFKLYYNGEISYEDSLVFDSVEYQILNIDKKILQDINIIYTIQGRA